MEKLPIKPLAVLLISSRVEKASLIDKVSELILETSIKKFWTLFVRVNVSPEIGVLLEEFNISTV